MHTLKIKQEDGKWLEFPILVGPQGPQGEIGPQGPQGLRGERGEPGHLLEVRDYYIKSSELGIDKTGTVDVTLALQAQIDYAYENGYHKVIFEEGTYLVSTQAPTEPISNSQYGGLELKPYMVYDLNGSTIKMKSNNSKGYNIIRIGGKDKGEYCDNVTLKNGSIIGDRQTHDYTTISSSHEFGFGVAIHNGRNIVIENMNITQCTGDCIFIGQIGNKAQWHSENITIRNCDLSYARRNIISPCSFDGLLIENCKLSYAGGSTTSYDGIAGTPPMFGIDIEPWSSDEVAGKAIIKDCQFKECYRAFIGVTKCEDLLITGCTFDNDETIGENAEYTIYASDRNSHIAMEKCIFTNVTGMYMNGFVNTAVDCDMGGTNIICGGMPKYSNYYFVKNCKASLIKADASAKRMEHQQIYADGCVAGIIDIYTEKFQIVNSDITLTDSRYQTIMASNCIVRPTDNMRQSNIDVFGDGVISNCIIDCSDTTGYIRFTVNVANCKFINLKYAVAFHDKCSCENCTFILSYDTANGNDVYMNTIDKSFHGVFKNCEFDFINFYDTYKTGYLDNSISIKPVSFGVCLHNAINSVVKVKIDEDIKGASLVGTGPFYNTIFENVGDFATAKVPSCQSEKAKDVVNCHFVNCQRITY